MEQAREGTHPFEFRGRAGEYFRIWIVNVLLTVLTLGIYSAWAKVRTNQYFYRNTYLDDAGFDYLAKPMQILKGRLLLAALIVIYAVAGHYAPGAQAVLMLLLFLLSPWIIQRALRFRLYNTAYRNLRFHFAGSVGESYGVFGKGVLVTLITLGLGFPWAIWLRSQYIVSKARYGSSEFAFGVRPGSFFGIYYGALVMLLVLGFMLMLFMGSVMGGLVGGQEQPDPAKLILAQVLTMLVLMPLYIFIWSFVQSRIFNAVMNNTTLGDHAFEADLPIGRLTWITLSNAVLVVLSLGLLLPWAKVRLTRFRLSHVRMLPSGSLSEFAAQQSAEVSAAGDELGDYLDLDLGF